MHDLRHHDPGMPRGETVEHGNSVPSRSHVAAGGYSRTLQKWTWKMMAANRIPIVEVPPLRVHYADRVYQILASDLSDMG